MKKLVMAIAAVSITTAAFSQNPTTVKDENLKGNVLSVTYSKYEYKENFGEPTEGKLLEQKAIFFDDQGRSVVTRTMTPVGSSNAWATSYVMAYSKDGANTKIDIAILNNGKAMPNSSVLPVFSQASKALENQYSSDAWPKKRAEIISDANGVITKWDVFEKIAQQEKEKLIGRRIATSAGNGVYGCKIYNKQGESVWDYKETYKGGLLTFLDNPRWFSGISSGKMEVNPKEAGNYEYDKNGRVIKYTQQKKNYGEEYFYNRNEHGDLVKVIRGQIGKDERYQNVDEIYDNYKYDSRGNWIFRTYAYKSTAPKFIEKREIQYCSSASELKSKSGFISVSKPDTKSENNFIDFYNENLKGCMYVATLPLSQYNSSLASQQEASDIIITLRMSFFPDKTCMTSRGAERDYEKVRKPKKNHLKFIEEYDGSGTTTIPYEYKDGMIIVNNEQYKVDSSTKTLINIGKNITYKKQ